MLTEFPDRSCPVTYTVFHSHSQFRKGSSRILRRKHRIVSEPFFSTFFSGYFTIYPSFKNVFLTIFNKRYHSTECGTPIVFPFKLRQKFSRIGFGVIAVSISITCRMNARCASQGHNFQTGVIGKTVKTVMLINVACLNEGVAFKRLCNFRNIRRTIDVRQRQYFYFVTDYSADLTDFMSIICSKYELFHKKINFFTGLIHRTVLR